LLLWKNVYDIDCFEEAHLLEGKTNKSTQYGVLRMPKR
jgi:hypothetical protein